VKPSLALLASPLLGPGVWQPVAKALAQSGWPSRVCAATASVATPQDALDAFGQALPPERDVVLVPHSNAGAYVPALVSRRRVIGVVFVDAVLPPSEGLVPLAPPSLRDFLRGMVRADGQLPGWTQWWDESDVATLLPRCRHAGAGRAPTAAAAAVVLRRVAAGALWVERHPGCLPRVR
jgi:hypothetical protein